MKDQKIGIKIMGMAIILLVLTAVCAGYGLVKINHVGDEIKAIAHEDIPMTAAITEVTINQLEQAIWFERALRHGHVLAEKDATAKGLKHAIEKYDQHTHSVNTILEKSKTLAAHAIEAAVNDEKRQEVEKIQSQIETIEKHHKEYEDHSHQVFGLIKSGQLHEATVQAEKDEQAAFSGMMVLTILALCAGLVMGLFMTRAITRPLHKGIVFAKALSKGDLTQKMDVDQKDEIGELAGALNHMGASLRAMFAKMAEGVNTLTSSSTELSAISQQMAGGAKEASGKSNQVAAAAEEMSANMNSVAASSEQAATNVQMVAAASEQMSSTINEIAGNTEKGRVITNEAVSQANNVSSRVAELGKAANEIGKVTETINDISEQTNLLALNATIEAARAGEAGKGFAVVANEIKELAKQTAEATKDIRIKIEGIQNTTAGTVTDISQIESVISDINEIVSTIATAVEEQSASTQDITGNVNQASQGIQDVNSNIAQCSTVSADIAGDVVKVNQAATEIADGSHQVNTSATELSKLSEELTSMITKYAY